MTYPMHGAAIYSIGNTTAMTDEATTLSDGKYFIAEDKQIWDLALSFVVKDGGVTVASSEYELNPFGGLVEFNSSYTVTGAVTVTGNYFPKLELVSYNEVTIETSRETEDVTSFAVASTGFRTRKLKLKTAEISLQGFESFSAVLGSNGVVARLDSNTETLVLVNLNPGGGVERSGFGMWGMHMKNNEELSVDALVKGGITIESTVRTDDVNSFDWF